MARHFTHDDFNKYKNVSRETFLRLQIFSELLEKWQKRINLISSSTVSDVWMRHIIDSAQLIDYIKPESRVADMGSGAGFPGMVLAIMGMKPITLIESDVRKVAFLREAARVSDVDINIVNQRVESTSLRDFSVITARGFASIAKILDSLDNRLSKSSNILLLKGKDYIQEMEDARGDWAFDYQAYPSITDKEGVILSLHNPNRKRSPS
jgi:16S rRNA (guanine527-N7)-methyltransferase